MPAAKAEVSALLTAPNEPVALFVFGHGAGAGMTHGFMEQVSKRLAARGIGTFRYQFPYMEAGRRRPDRTAVLEGTVRAAVERAGELADGLPLFAGGKSMGGRMSSLAASQTELPDVRGLVFFGFPLHAPGRPSIDRADHLADVTVPKLFLQGTRDRLAELPLIEQVTSGLQQATLSVIDGADHSFHMLKRSGRTEEEVLDELCTTAADWMIHFND